MAHEYQKLFIELGFICLAAATSAGCSSTQTLPEYSAPSNNIEVLANGVSKFTDTNGNKFTVQEIEGYLNFDVTNFKSESFSDLPSTNHISCQYSADPDAEPYQFSMSFESFKALNAENAESAHIVLSYSYNEKTDTLYPQEEIDNTLISDDLKQELREYFLSDQPKELCKELISVIHSYQSQI